MPDNLRAMRLSKFGLTKLVAERASSLRWLSEDPFLSCLVTLLGRSIILHAEVSMNLFGRRTNVLLIVFLISCARLGRLLVGLTRGHWRPLNIWKQWLRWMLMSDGRTTDGLRGLSMICLVLSLV